MYMPLNAISKRIVYGFTVVIPSSPYKTIGGHKPPGHNRPGQNPHVSGKAG